MLRFFFGYVLVSLLLGAGLLITFFPEHPSSVAGWIGVFALAVPITLVGEFVGQLLFVRNPLSRAVDRRTRHKTFSWARVLFGLLLVVAVVATIQVALHFFGVETS